MNLVTVESMRLVAECPWVHADNILAAVWEQRHWLTQVSQNWVDILAFERADILLANVEYFNEHLHLDITPDWIKYVYRSGE